MPARYPFDRIDRRILTLLQDEGRLTNQMLSERVSLSPSACLARVRRLEKAGVIQGYHARLDPFSLNIGMVLFAEVTLKTHSPADLARFEAEIDAIPQIVEASHVSGAYDYLLKVVVAGMNEWNEISHKLTGGGSGAERVITHVLMDKPKIFVGYPIDT